MAEPPLLTVSGARLSFGGRALFTEAGFTLSKGDKAALVGRNGSGKSSLLRAAAGEVPLDAGTRFLQPGATLGYLEQEPLSPAGRRIEAEVLAGLPPDKHEETYRAGMILEPLGLAGQRRLDTLSGGERRRVALAKALVGDPDLLLLDEPTNHLDLPAIEWLEGLLARYRGALLIISHDRRFLTNLTDKLLWLDRGTLHRTDQGFSGFEAFAERIRHEEAKAREREDKKIARETQWLREGLTARRKRDQGRLRQLEQLREQRRQRQNEPGQAKITLGEATGGSRLVLEAEHLRKTLPTPAGERAVVADFSTRLLRGDRMGVIGPNGAGKTTLLRLLLGELAPDSGELRHGNDFAPVYFDQQRAALSEDMTPRDYLCPHGGDYVTVQGQTRHVASYMRDFLFDNGALEQRVRAFSGGERNRLMLAKLFAQPGNVLVLDEPTNDLDMDTLDLLEETLAAYDGTVILVSHDREFLDRLVTSVVALEGDGSTVEIVGGFGDYDAWRKKQGDSAAGNKAKGKAAESKPAGKAKPAAGTQGGKAGAAPASPHKLSYKQKKELAELPDKIDRLQAEIDRLQAKLADPGLYSADPEDYNATARQLTETQEALEAAETRWLELEELREQLQA